MPDQTASVLDFESAQVKVGLEVHQQLATKSKLFCACSPFVGDESSSTFENISEFRRILRPASSELGEVDEAAQFESRREIRVRYLASPDTCLVEADEEPPHPINNDALETALIFSLTLGSRIADEIHVMRKIVVDGSNTSGFQRTAVISLGGKLAYGDRTVEVQTVGLEEDACRAVKQNGGAESDKDERTYALDRLGTPLVEVALAPIEGTPEDIENAARTLGRMMRSTRRVARGLGTIRQDLNISVMNGKVIEVKGIQRLEQIRKIVQFEASRQKFFFDLAAEIRKKIGNQTELLTLDATDLFAGSKAGVIKKSLASGGRVRCIIVRNFAGFIGRENAFHSRLGKELGAIAKTYGLGGVFHSDELPNYGITEEEVFSLRKNRSIAQEDAFVLIAGPEEKIEKASVALTKRLEYSAIGVPAETRAANLEGETTFLRPRPGAARMYPETDIPLIQVSENVLKRLRSEIPEPWEKQVRDFAERFDLPNQLAEPVFDSDRRDLFEQIVNSLKLPTRLVASILVDTFLSLSREGVEVGSLNDEKLFEIFRAMAEGKFAKEVLPDVLRVVAKNEDIALQEALSKAGVSSISHSELETIVDEIIAQNLDLIKAKGISGAQSTLMGKVMQRVRGKVDGKQVSETLSKHLSETAKKS